MIPFRTQVKFFLDHPESIELAPFAAVFQRWIQQSALKDMLIDVADYRHVFEGPGVMLMGHFSEYAIESRSGRPGLLYTRKRQHEGTLQEQLRVSFQLALAAAQLLEAEATFDPRLKFRADEIEIRFADRLQLPNRAESFEAVKADIEAVLAELYGGRAVQFVPVQHDARHLFTVNVHGEGAVAVSELLQGLQQVA